MRYKGNEDCFAYKADGCVALDALYCKTDTCSFYKTREQERLCRKRYGYNLEKYALKKNSKGVE